MLDFGGSLGSTYFQNRDILQSLDVCWHIVEQNNFVELGRKKIPEISFHKTIDEYLNGGNNPDILLLSGVIQYFDTPYKYLEKLLEAEFRFIIIDRSFFNIEHYDRLGIQYVPPSIYAAEYPVWLLDKNKVIEMVKSQGYRLLDSWESFDRMPVELRKGKRVIIKSEGFLLTR